MRLQHLHRTWYLTDANTKDPEYLGTFTQSFPANEGSTIVGIAWDKPSKGWVEVTFLINGEGFTPDNPYPWPGADVTPVE